MNFNKEIEKTMNHTYMVLSKDKYFDDVEEADYRLPMLLQNKITGLVSVSQQSLNGENKLYYEISGLENLEEAFLHKEMDYKSVKELFAGCVNIYSNIEEYMLDGEQIILLPEYIFVDSTTRKPQFIFYPEYGKDARKAFVELIEYVLEKLDHNDESTVMLGYNIYRITRNSNFTMQEIENALVESNETICVEESESKPEADIEKEEGRVTEIFHNESHIENNEKINIKEKFKNSINQPPEVLGMIASGVVMSLLCGFWIYGLNNGLFFAAEQITLYLLGGIAMCFMTILMLFYTLMKKRKQVIS